MSHFIVGPSSKSPKKNEQLKIHIDSESEDDFILKNPKKLSMSPKINIGPMIDSEKFHEKSRNSLWEAFITSKEPKESSIPSPKPKDKFVSPKEKPVSPKEKLTSPKEKPVSPKDKLTSPKEKPVSPKPVKNVEVQKKGPDVK